MAFMERHRMTKEDAADLLWLPDAAGECTWPDRWAEILGTVLSQLREKTEPFGFAIRALRHGRGNPGFYLYWRMAEGVG